MDKNVESLFCIIILFIEFYLDGNKKDFYDLND